MNLFAIFTVALVSSVSCHSFVEGMMEAFYTGFQVMKCPFGDCCNDYWIPANVTQLELSLKEEVFGQHIATDIIYKQLVAHLTNKSPSKALVMSFHGWTGNGKNHVAYLLAKSMFRRGTISRNYHHFMATTHFPNALHAKDYENNLRNWVKGNVSNCPQSIFVFDEVDKMPAGVVDGIRSYLDYTEHVDKVDFRQVVIQEAAEVLVFERAIFIFLSNTGGQEIIKKVLKVWDEGKKKREELTVRDFERLVELGAFNDEDGGLHKSYIIEKSLIDVYVPFLPMEKRHVRLCAEKEFRNQNYVPSDIDNALETIVDSLNYYPEDQELYSMTGCKRVAQRVGIYIANEKYKGRFNKKKTEL